MRAGTVSRFGDAARPGLDPWSVAELPVPPAPSGLGWLRVVGPGVIVPGLSIGSGELLLGPAVFVKHGLVLCLLRHALAEGRVGPVTVAATVSRNAVSTSTRGCHRRLVFALAFEKRSCLYTASTTYGRKPGGSMPSDRA